MWLCDRRVSTADRVGLGSSPRIRSSPVSTREKAREVGDAQGLQHRRGQDLAHPALQGQPPVAGPRPRRLARALGGQVEQSAGSAISRSWANRKPRPSPRSGVVACGTDGRDSAWPAAPAGCPAVARSARSGSAIRRRSAPPAPRVAAARSLRNRRSFAGSRRAPPDRRNPGQGA